MSHETMEDAIEAITGQRPVCVQQGDRIVGDD